MKRLLLAILAMAAIASCSKESSMDVSITSTQTPIEFTAYAGSATTKGTPVDTNAKFEGSSGSYNSFEVSAYLDTDDTDTTSPAKYFAFSSIAYSGSAWTSTNMYWPNYDATLYFGATYPASAVTTPTYSVSYDETESVDANVHSLKFDYTVAPDVDGNSGTTGTVAGHKDIMYAIASQAYTAQISGTTDTESTTAALHFKHALTQIAFTATKASNIDVTVSAIQLCNIMSSGSFEATTVTTDTNTADGYVNMSKAGSWDADKTSNIAHYKADMAYTNNTDPIAVTATTGATSPTVLTDANDALMLIPQELTGWDPITANSNATSDTSSYLAITCTITHTAGTTSDTMAPIYDGVVYISFSTENIDYDNNTSNNESTSTDGQWEPGYKITYNLDFGGGYIDTTTATATIPDPGKTPVPDNVIPTLRPITYTITVDAWETPTGDTE